MAKAKKKSKKSKKSLGLFVFATLMFLLFLALAIGLSVRPYSTITPYTFENEEGNLKINITYGAGDTYKIDGSYKDKEFSTELDFTDDMKAHLKDVNKANKENLNAFNSKDATGISEIPVVGSVIKGILNSIDFELVNKGNIAVVALSAIISAIFLGVALANVKKAF